jgi:hypothetical protein
MSTTDATSLIVAVVAIVVAVITATFQILELRRQTTRTEAQLASSADDALEESLRHLSCTFLDHPELRSIFQPSPFAPAPEKGIMSRETRLRAETVCDDLMDTFERAYRNAADPLYPWKGEIWAYFDQMMQSSDFMFEYLLEHEPWWKSKLVERAIKARPKEAAIRGNETSLIRVVRPWQRVQTLALYRVVLSEDAAGSNKREIGSLRSGGFVEQFVPPGSYFIEVIQRPQTSHSSPLRVTTLSDEVLQLECRSRHAIFTSASVRMSNPRERSAVRIDLSIADLDPNL